MEIFKKKDLDEMVNIIQGLSVYFSVKEQVEAGSEVSESLKVTFKELFGRDYQELPLNVVQEAIRDVINYFYEYTHDILEETSVGRPVRLNFDLCCQIRSFIDNFETVASSESLLAGYPPKVIYQSTLDSTNNFLNSCRYNGNKLENELCNATDIVKSLQTIIENKLKVAQDNNNNGAEKRSLIKLLLGATLAISALDAILLASNTCYNHIKEINASKLGDEFKDEEDGFAPGIDVEGSLNNERVREVKVEAGYLPEETHEIEMERFDRMVDGMEALLLGNLDKDKHKRFLNYCFMTVEGNESFADSIKDTANKAFDGISTFFKTLKEFIIKNKKDSSQTIEQCKVGIEESIGKLNDSKDDLEIKPELTKALVDKLNSVDEDELANAFKVANNKTTVINAFKSLVNHMSVTEREISKLESQANSISNSPNEVLTLANKAKDDMDSDTKKTFKEEVNSTIEEVRAKGRELNSNFRDAMKTVSIYTTALQVAKKISALAK